MWEAPQAPRLLSPPSLPTRLPPRPAPPPAAGPPASGRGACSGARAARRQAREHGACARFSWERQLSSACSSATTRQSPAAWRPGSMAACRGRGPAPPPPPRPRSARPGPSHRPGVWSPTCQDHRLHARRRGAWQCLTSQTAAQRRRPEARGRRGGCRVLGTLVFPSVAAPCFLHCFGAVCCSPRHVHVARGAPAMRTQRIPGLVSAGSPATSTHAGPGAQVCRSRTPHRTQLALNTTSPLKLAGPPRPRMPGLVRWGEGGGGCPAGLARSGWKLMGGQGWGQGMRGPSVCSAVGKACLIMRACCWCWGSHNRGFGLSRKPTAPRWPPPRPAQRPSPCPWRSSNPHPKPRSLVAHPQDLGPRPQGSRSWKRAQASGRVRPPPGQQGPPRQPQGTQIPLPQP